MFLLIILSGIISPLLDHLNLITGQEFIQKIYSPLAGDNFYSGFEILALKKQFRAICCPE
jgi:hypothetical protein